jgi:hypothetical protein
LVKGDFATFSSPYYEPAKSERRYLLVQSLPFVTKPRLPAGAGSDRAIHHHYREPTIPLSNSENLADIQLAALCAAFHFGAIEQGSASLYNGLLDAMISPLARAIVASIGPTELYHFVALRASDPPGASFYLGLGPTDRRR